MYICIYTNNMRAVHALQKKRAMKLARKPH